jgi:radical SAM protein with 4Fe4S-binding SPASM domain
MSERSIETVLSLKKSFDNPIFRALLKFIVKRDRCGNRLEIAIDQYLGKKVNACWKCRIAGKIVSYAIRKGEKVFSIPEKEVRKGLKENVFKRGLINVLKGIAEYGITKPQMVAAPFLVVWDFTHACNLKCKHCYEKADKPLPDELTTDEAKELIDNLTEIGTVSIAFSGGEPLLRKDFFEIVNYAHKKGLYVAVATNGTLITKDIARRMKKCVDYVEISVDGADAKTHDSFRGVKGAFRRTIRGIKNCVDTGIYTCIATTVTKYNLKQIPKICDLAHKLRVNRLIIFNFIPTGNGIEIAKKDLTPDQREKLLKFLAEKLINNEGIEVFSTAPQYARVTTYYGVCSPTHFYASIGRNETILRLAEFIGGCGAGRIYCAIEPNGDVQPCVFMPIKIGNVRERSFKEIWKSSRVFDDLRDRSKLKGHCSTCDYKFICGGCRARAYAYFNDYLAPDPGCIFNKKEWLKIAK